MQPGAKVENCRIVKLPKKYARHPSIVGRIFYTFPRKLLDAIKARCGRRSFSPQLVDMEYELSDVLANDPTIVGFENGQAIFYPFLFVDGDRLASP